MKDVKFIIHAMNYILKSKLFIMFLMIAGFLFSSELQSQIKVSGVVKDTFEEVLIGATVVEKGTKNVVITDIDGRFEISVNKPDALLEVSYIGYERQTVPVKGSRNITIILEPTKDNSLNEVVVVGYGTQAKSSVTGAISQISGNELLKAPTTSINNLIGGRLPGVVSYQSSGQPGADAASLLVRGSSATYVVDGIPRAFSEIDPNDVETISVLKDASSAAVYGMDATSVIIITTKRGATAASKITFNATYGISNNTTSLKMLDGPQYAYWYNKAREMDGDSPVFTGEHIRMMLANENGWGNTDWYNKTFGTGNNSTVNVNASGGTDKLKYYVSIGNFNQQGNVDNFTYNRINLRSNIDATIANNLTLTFDIAGRIEQRKNPGYGANPGDWNNIPQQAIRALPYVPSEINGIPVSTNTASAYVSPLAAAELTGYNRVKTNVIQTNLALKYDMPFLKGLSAKFLISYDYSDQMSKLFSTPYYTYVASLPGPGLDQSMQYRYTNDYRGVNTSLLEGLAHNNKIVTNTSLTYNGAVGDHSFAALGLFETREGNFNNFSAKGLGFDILELDELNYASMKDKNDIGGLSSVTREVGLVGRLNYAYQSKYLVEVAARYDGSYRFGGKSVEGKRWVLTPGTSVGWRMSEENFIKDNFDFVNNLKLRGSVGLTALTSGLPAYFYLNTLSPVENVAVFGGKNVNGLNTSAPANTNLTWAKSLQYDLGLDFTLWNGLLGMEFDVFYKYIYDLPLVLSSTVPGSFGGYVYQYANVGEQDHKGFEIHLTHRNKIGDFSYNVGINGTYADRRWISYPDAVNTPDWLKLTGKQVGAQQGFIADGLFRSEEDIATSALIPGRAVKVGDIKYIDRNGDGKVTYEQDRGYVGKSATPDFMGGINIGGAWNGIDFSMSWIAGLGRDVALTGVYSTGVMDHTSMTRPFYHGGNSPAYLLENSWTEENPNADFPRLSVSPASSNNAYSSTFWYKNGDYLRLKSLQIGYTFPVNLIKSLNMSELRVYVEGLNLLTFSELTKYKIDPEQPGVSNGYYPQQRVLSAGIKVSF